MFPAKSTAREAIRGNKSIPTIGLTALFAAAAIIIALGLTAPTVKAESSPAASAAADSVWIVSTRRAPLCGRSSATDASFDYRRLDADENGDRQWLESDAEAFHAADVSEGPTCFYIHGNRISHCEAIQEGFQVLKCLKSQSEGRKFRLVIWSWPSMQINGGNRQDVRVKAARSDTQAYYLAGCLRQMDANAQVGMIGYSFGARVISGALEILAGGRVAGYSLDADAEANSSADGLPQMRIVLIAAAIDRCWLMPGRRNGSALDVADWALVTKNSCDPVLKYYPKMYGCRGPEAAGYAGPALTMEQREKTEVLNLSCSVGKSHQWNSYLRSPCLYWRLGECVFVDVEQAAKNE